jgi:hypothetical protein
MRMVMVRFSSAQATPLPPPLRCALINDIAIHHSLRNRRNNPLRWKGGKFYDAVRSIHSGFVLPETPSSTHRVTARKMCGGYTADAP